MSETNQALDHDAAELKKMGYEQELHRHMGGFSNFAISFSIICTKLYLFIILIFLVVQLCL